MTAAAITGGDILLEQVRQEHLTPVIAKLTECNAKTEVTSSGLRVYRKGRLRPIQLKTMPYPGFPTDMQALFEGMTALRKNCGLWARISNVRKIRKFIKCLQFIHIQWKRGCYTVRERYS